MFSQSARPSRWPRASDSQSTENDLLSTQSDFLSNEKDFLSIDFVRRAVAVARVAVPASSLSKRSAK
jgi:hypothetical protein